MLKKLFVISILLTFSYFKETINVDINDPEVRKVSRFAFGTFLSDGHILETTDAKKISGPRVRYQIKVKIHEYYECRDSDLDNVLNEKTEKGCEVNIFIENYLFKES
jgi:hypothetical protein